MKLIKNYWNTLLQIKEWRKVRESYEKLRGEYAEFGQVAILEEIAQNSTPDDKTIPRKDIENFVFDTFKPEEIQNWIKFTPLELVAAVIERVATPPESLRWYEKVKAQKAQRILSDEQLKFVRLRWLKVKERRLQYLLENKKEEKHKHEYEDFKKKLNLWKISIHEVKRQPEYPPIMTRSVPIQAEWDGTHCRLTFKDQSVIIDVINNNVIEFKVNVVDKAKQSDRFVFRVEDWDVKGEILSSKKLVLYYKGEPWKEYEIKQS